MKSTVDERVSPRPERRVNYDALNDRHRLGETRDEGPVSRIGTFTCGLGSDFLL